MRRFRNIIAASSLAVLLLADSVVAQGGDDVTLVSFDQEVLARGPIHEAFANPVTFNARVGVIVPKSPPDEIEELPPAERPEAIPSGSKAIGIGKMIPKTSSGSAVSGVSLHRTSAGCQVIGNKSMTDSNGYQVSGRPISLNRKLNTCLHLLTALKLVHHHHDLMTTISGSLETGYTVRLRTSTNGKVDTGGNISQNGFGFPPTMFGHQPALSTVQAIGTTYQPHAVVCLHLFALRITTMLHGQCTPLASQSTWAT